jgi:hypothetical protein
LIYVVLEGVLLSHMVGRQRHGKMNPAATVPRHDHLEVRLQGFENSLTRQLAMKANARVHEALEIIRPDVRSRQLDPRSWIGANGNDLQPITVPIVASLGELSTPHPEPKAAESESRFTQGYRSHRESSGYVERRAFRVASAQRLAFSCEARA